MNYEAALISRIVLERKIQEVVDFNLQDELFVSCKDEWKFIRDFYRTHGDSPPGEHFEKMFPEFEVVNTQAPLSFLVEELRDRRMYNLAAQAMKVAAGQLKIRHPREAVDTFRKMIMEVEVQTRPAKDVNVAENPTERLKQYDEAVASEGLLGIPSPWAILDEKTMGFQDEELWMIVARGGIGKTWCEVVASRYQWAQGYRPLLFTKEMSVNQIIKRLDAAHARVAHQRLRAGQLTHEEYARYKETLQLMEGAGPFWISGDDEGAGGVSGILAKIDRYKPNIVWVDGMYLVEDERRASSGWERLKNIAGDLKSVARRRNIPVIVSHQFNQEGKEDKGTADTLAYGDIQKWFDGIIGMYQTEDLRLNKEMFFKLLKHREGEKFEFVADWDLENMIFDVKGLEVDDVGTVECEEDKINF